MLALTIAAVFLTVFLLVMALAQLASVAGWAEYFPWAIPGAYSQGVLLGRVSYAIVFITSALGTAATFLWWELADQTH